MLIEAEKIIKKSGLGIIQTTCLSIDWVLLKLDVKDMRDIVLKLTERGFFVHGINATDRL